MARLRFNSQAGELNAGSTHNGGVILPTAAIALTDAVFNATTTVTSAMANFDAALHTGAPLDGNALVPAGAYIQSVTDAHTIVMSAAATGSGTAEALTVHAEKVMNSPELASLPAITTAGDYAVAVLDPNGVSGPPEVVYITYHAATDTWAQIERNPAGEGATPRSHVQGESWLHGPVVTDFGSGGGGTQVPGILASSATPTPKRIMGTLAAPGAIYTVPTGKTALMAGYAAALEIPSMVQSNSIVAQGGLCLWNPTVTGAAQALRGVYVGPNAATFDAAEAWWRGSLSETAPGTPGPFFTSFGVMEAGDVLAIDGDAGLAYIITLFELDATHFGGKGLRTQGASSFTYTAPAAGAIWTGAMQLFVPAIVNGGAVFSTYFYVVPSGGSPGGDNLMMGGSYSGAANTAGTAASVGPTYLGPGDELVIHVDTNTTGTLPEGGTALAGVNIFTDVYELVS